MLIVVILLIWGCSGPKGVVSLEPNNGDVATVDSVEYELIRNLVLAAGFTNPLSFTAILRGVEQAICIGVERICKSAKQKIFFSEHNWI